MPVLQHFRHLGPDILDIDPARVGKTVLHDLGVTWVVLDRYKMPGGLERSYTTDLTQAIFAGQSPLYEDERITVYRVDAPSEPEAYVVLGPTGWGPLMEDEHGVSRQIGADRAVVQLRHLPPSASMTIRYSTAGDLPVQVIGEDGPGATLPPAPDGYTAILDLEAIGAGKEIAFFSSDRAGARIESIRLMIP
jgi:hypothetical protein